MAIWKNGKPDGRVVRQEKKKIERENILIVNVKNVQVGNGEENGQLGRPSVPEEDHPSLAVS